MDITTTGSCILGKQDEEIPLINGSIWIYRQNHGQVNTCFRLSFNILKTLSCRKRLKVSFSINILFFLNLLIADLPFFMSQIFLPTSPNHLHAVIQLSFIKD